MIRFYLMPAVIEVRNARLEKHPKYDALWAGKDFHVMDHGREGTFLCAVDVDAAQHAAIIANADIATFPVDLTTQIGAGALANITTILESRHFHIDGITATSTYRQVLRRVIRCCLMAQRAEGMRFELFPTPSKTQMFSGGITLNSAWADLTDEDRTVLIEVFRSFRFNRGTLTAASTMRQIFAAFVTQWPATDINLLGVDL